jgi:hypothetical protein
LRNIIAPQHIATRHNYIEPHMFARGKEHNSSTAAPTYYLNIVAITLINFKK